MHYSAACRVDPEHLPAIVINFHVSKSCWRLRWQGETSISPAVSPHTSITYPANFFFVIAPDVDIQGPMEEYFKMGVSDVQMGDLLKAHYDSNVYGLRYSTIFCN